MLHAAFNQQSSPNRSLCASGTGTRKGNEDARIRNDPEQGIGSIAQFAIHIRKVMSGTDEGSATGD